MSSNEPVRSYSGIVTAQVAMSAAAATKIFDNAGATAGEQDAGSFPLVRCRQIKNGDATNTVYIGDSAVTAADGYALAPGETLSLNSEGGPALYLGEIWGIAGAGTPKVSTLQF